MHQQLRGRKEKQQEGVREGERERESFGLHNRLTKQHINLQVHLIVGKLNAALSEGRSIY